MQQGAAYDDYSRLVARIRRVRALHGDTAPRRTHGAAALRWRTINPRLSVSMILCWALCIILPLGAGLRVRAVLGRHASLSTSAARPSPLVRDALTRLLGVTPAARLTTVAGTAEVVAWSPDGRYLAAGYSGGALLLWDVARERLAARIVRAHHRFIGALAWSPDGRLLATAAADGTAVVWRVGGAPALAPVAVIRTAPLRVPAVAFAPGGGTLAVADGLPRVTLWDVSGANAAGRPRRASAGVRPWRILSVGGRTTALAWSPDGARLAVGTTEGGVVLWRRGDGWRPTTRALGSTVWALAWSPGGSTLAAGCADGAVRLLSGANMRPESTLVAPFHRAPVMQVLDYGAPARSISSTRRTGSRETKAGPGRPPALARLAVGAAINNVAWSPDGGLLAVTATGVPLRLWRPFGGAVLATYHPAWDQNVVAWRPDGTLAAVAMDDGGVVLLRVAAPAFLTDVACRLGAGDWCALLSRPLAPVALAGAPTAFMGR